MGIQEKVYSASPIWLQNVLISAKGYRLRKQRFGGKNADAIVARHREIETFSRDKAAELQLEMLKAFVAHAARSVPHYRKSIEGIPEVSQLSDIRKLPVLEKDMLRRNTQSFRSQAVTGPFFEAHTSGTTGTPITVQFTQADSQDRMLAWERMWNWYGVGRDSRKIRFSGRTLFPHAELNRVFWRMNYASNQMFMSSYHMTAQNLDAYLDKIESFKPEILDGYPSSIYLLARHALTHGRWTIRPKLVMTTAETLEDFQREVIRKAFQTEPKTQYGSSEGAPLACEDENGEIALLPQTGIIEIVRPGTDEWVAEGEVGEMLVTCFNTHAYPLIRYRIGDTGALDGYTRRRPGFRRLSQLSGRQEDYVISPERGPVGRLDPVFKKSPPSIIECQIVQTGPNTLELHYVPDPSTFKPDHLIVVADEIRLRCGAMDISFVSHNGLLPRSANGKLRAVVGCNSLGFKLPQPTS